ncbi:unnamed protein product [Pleuronectes platessa]|uniref:Uncharacterized protein n=1 Tax=Pleuronectes platessa TaxID=8262 RepID=A0A9N7UL53_PLEPL|nr:unnamed protein product [Pleuronectes platessa]
MSSRQNLENGPRSLPRVYLSHMPNPAGASLHRHVHNKSSALFRPHIDFSWISTDFIPGGQADKVEGHHGASHSDICVHTCTSSGENMEELRCPPHD